VFFIEPHIGDIGIVLLLSLVLLYYQWDSLFHDR